MEIFWIIGWVFRLFLLSQNGLLSNNNAVPLEAAIGKPDSSGSSRIVLGADKSEKREMANCHPPKKT